MKKKLFLVLALVGAQLHGAERALEAGKGTKGNDKDRLYLANLGIAGAGTVTFGTFFGGAALLTAAGSLNPCLGVPFTLATLYPLAVCENARRKAFENLPPEKHKAGQVRYKMGSLVMASAVLTGVVIVSGMTVIENVLSGSTRDNLTDGTEH